MILLIPHQGVDVRCHESVDEAKTSIKSEYDVLYGDNIPWQWRWDRHEEIWFGHPVDQEDVLWAVKEMP